MDVGRHAAAESGLESCDPQVRHGAADAARYWMGDDLRTRSDRAAFLDGFEDGWFGFFGREH
ncbi:hypothetical protein B8W67_05465 [Mycolicibacillus koreensis]|uniref:Uncharacterized protein n=1 Tax=Mycolicibacillus koreensis TaxID=1069220 RepID=A0AA91PG13_9MYCO|nr:hypothetical protein B8W67_05465 [Mycolicibacillus koreensis]